MSFETVVLADVKLDSNDVPVGTYVFQLLPTAEVKANKFTGAEELNLSAAVAEGEYAGKRVFWNYPDPQSVDQNGKSKAWSAQAMKKLEVTLGIDANPGESLTDYFNRAAANNPRFKATIAGNPKKPEQKPRLNIFSVAPAA